jgi:hypothetical protein
VFSIPRFVRFHCTPCDAPVPFSIKISRQDRLQTTFSTPVGPWAARYEVEHTRKFGAQESSSLPEHRAAMVAAVSGKCGKRYLKRQQLLELESLTPVEGLK